MATKVVTMKSFRVEGELDYTTLADMARAAAAAELGRDIPEGAFVSLYVYVPAGGDWSSTRLETENYPVEFVVEWSETEDSDGR